MATDAAIIISAYNRPASLARLLASVEKAVYNGDDVTLVISIDKSDSTDVAELAAQFEWSHGPKKIIQHEKHLGLKAHILSCGDLSATYGSVILLEDDLLVSPYFYMYAKQAQTFYGNDSGIAGISLYNYQVSESSFYPFTAIDDGTDVYFMQVASSLGQLWTKEHWQLFKSWYADHPELPLSNDIPDYLQKWGPQSWKKHFTHYLTDTNTYLVFPRTSLTTNFEDSGTHASTVNRFQVPIQLSPKEFRFATLQQSGACYDAWFELLPRCLNTYTEFLKLYNYAVDLHGTKQIKSLTSEYVLTSQQANDAVMLFGTDLLPLEANVAMNLSGDAIGLFKIRSNSFKPRKLALRHVLEEQDRENRFGISVIVPVEKEDTERLTATLLSIATQTFKNKECILISNDALSDALKKTIVTCGFPVKIIRTNHLLNVEQLVGLGFKKANKGILTRTLPGNIFAPNALQQVHSVFSSNTNISWIRGVDEAPNADLNVRKYRLTAGEAYSRLKKNKLNVSTEQDFFRKHCFETATGTFSFAGFFFECIQSYQLIIVVSKLGTKLFSDPALNPGQQQQLLKTYSHLDQKRSPGIFFADLFLRTMFPSAKINQWLHPTIKKFPNVLRYDAKHGTFYQSRY